MERVQLFAPERRFKQIIESFLNSGGTIQKSKWRKSYKTPQQAPQKKITYKIICK